MPIVAKVAPRSPLPAGSMLELPGRGETFVVDTGRRDPGAPTLVLLHALSCTGLLTWYPVLDRLAAKARVIAFDQRWHGRGIRSPRFRLTDLADDVVAVADALDVDRFVPVGYSMGSIVAQLTWRAHPERVAGLVLAAAPTTFRRHPRERVALDAIARAGHAFGTAGRGRVGGVEVTDRAWAIAQFRQTTTRAIVGATGEIGRFDSTGWVGEIDVPTAVVITANDRVLSPGRQRWLARNIAGATAYEVDCGHAGIVLEAEEFAAGLMPAVTSVLTRIG